MKNPFLPILFLLVALSSCEPCTTNTHCPAQDSLETELNRLRARTQALNREVQLQEATLRSLLEELEKTGISTSHTVRPDSTVGVEFVDENEMEKEAE